MILDDKALAQLEAEIANRNDATAMESACGEYNCPCHYRLPALCQTVRALKDANKALAKDVVTATNQAHKYRDESESLRNQQWTAARVISWLDDPLPKPAIHAFTEGNERQIAYRVERLREQLAQLTKERDDALMWLKIHKNAIQTNGNMSEDEASDLHLLLLDFAKEVQRNAIYLTIGEIIKAQKHLVRELP